MKKLLLFLFIINTLYVNAQSATLTPGSAGNVQLPKLSCEQIQAIPNPKPGMMVFDSTFKCLKYFNGSKWQCTSQSDEGVNCIGFAWQRNVYTYEESHEVINDIVVDNHNNVYITGWTGVNPVTYGFVAKFSSTGELLWEYKDPEMFRNGFGIKLDANNNVYVIFEYFKYGYSSISLYKFKLNGSVDWKTNIGGERYTYRRYGDLFIDNNQDLYVTGSFTGNIIAGPYSAEGNKAFVYKVSNNGTSLWLRTLPTAKVKVDKNGDYYFNGSLTSPTNIEGTTLFPSSSENIFFGKFYKNGTLAWIKKSDNLGIHKSESFTIDNNGDLYITGSFTEAISFDGTKANSIEGEDYYIVKYRSDGRFMWIRNGGGNGIDKGLQIEITTDNEPIVLGSASNNSLVFYPNIRLNIPTLPGEFLIKYFPETGDMSWIKAVEFSANFKITSSGDIISWKNIPITPDQSSYLPYGHMNLFTKFSSDGLLKYRKINGGIITGIGFGINNHFFFAGTFHGVVQIGQSILGSPNKVDLYISHWME